jgi:NADH:ubiquinone oxidoreductase subunit 6 (subunit J)
MTVYLSGVLVAFGFIVMSLYFLKKLYRRECNKFEIVTLIVCIILTGLAVEYAVNQTTYTKVNTIVYVTLDKIQK